MTKPCIIFYVFDESNKLIDSFNVHSSVSSEMTNSNITKKINFQKKFVMDGYVLSEFSRLLKVSDFYSKMVISNFLNALNFMSTNCDINIKLQLVRPKVEILDYAWNDRITNLVAQRQELEHAMSWLSTLGGAFSALGDSFENCAKIAGKISIHQLKIAFQLGEPLLVSRCRLYIALSLIQLGRLSVAKKMIQKQYELAKAYKDVRLQNICKGIWAKLKYVIQVNHKKYS